MSEPEGSTFKDLASPHELGVLGLRPAPRSVCLCTEKCLQSEDKRHPPKRCRGPGAREHPPAQPTAPAGHADRCLLGQTADRLRTAGNSVI